MRRSACLLLFAVACKVDPVPPVVSVPPVPAPAPSAPIQTTKATDEAPWSEGALTASKQFDMRRDQSGLHLAHAGVEITLPPPKLGECVEELPPDHGTEASSKGSSVWVTLRGNAETASLRLSTRGALLAVRTDCLRVADLSASLIGSEVESEDPVFDLPDFGDGPGPASMERAPRKTTLLLADEAFVSIAHFDGDVELAAKPADSGHEARATISTETEWNDGESVAGREHTLAWRLPEVGEPVLLLENDYRYGADGPDREDARLSMERWWNHRVGAIRLIGERVEVAHASNVGAGKCPETEGVVSYKHQRESVVWMLESTNGRAVRLGEATRSTTEKSACATDLSVADLEQDLTLEQASRENVAWRAIR